MSQEEAQRSGVAYIGTEHLLAAMVNEPGYKYVPGSEYSGTVVPTIPFRVLEHHGVTVEKVRKETLAILGHSSGKIHQEMIFTPRSKRVIEYAYEEARLRNHNYIATEHLFLALLRIEDSVAGRVLKNISNVEMKELYNETCELVRSEDKERRATIGSEQLQSKPGAAEETTTYTVVEFAERFGNEDCVRLARIYTVRSTAKEHTGSRFYEGLLYAVNYILDGTDPNNEFGEQP